MKNSTLASPLHLICLSRFIICTYHLLKMAESRVGDCRSISACAHPVRCRSSKSFQALSRLTSPHSRSGKSTSSLRNSRPSQSAAVCKVQLPCAFFAGSLQEEEAKQACGRVACRFGQGRGGGTALNARLPWCLVSVCLCRPTTSSSSKVQR